MALPADIAKIKNISSIFVIFGATGDLSSKKILPSFFQLSKAGLLPEKFKIIGAARSKLTNNQFRNRINQKLKDPDPKAWDKFSSQIEYISCDIAENLNIDKIASKLEDLEEEVNLCPQRIFYMAISPFIYQKAFDNLGKNRLHLGCQIHGRKSRIVIEKPFGYDLASALKLETKLKEFFQEEQIYRIDHFLGKETVQNILAFRFGNELFEPIWNQEYIDHVQITLAEHVGIEKRGEYYDKAGALRDVVQNHLLHLLAIVTMDAPKKFEQESMRAQRLEIIKNIKKLKGYEVESSTVRGQYEGYTSEEKVQPNSQTETYALVKLFIDTPRWQGVPFYLRTGKKLMGKVTSIIFQFKERGHKFFENFWDKPMPNHITIQIQPNEGIGVRLVAKKPGLTTVLEPVDMEFCYKSAFDVPQPDAYERLLLDIILGDRTLFLGQVADSWKFIDPIEKVWASGKPKLASYKPGSWGPKEADELIEKDGRQWLAPILTICKI